MNAVTWWFERALGTMAIVPQSRCVKLSLGMLAAVLCAACRETNSSRLADDSASARAIPKANGAIAADTATRTLATAAGVAEYHIDQVPVAAGRITGRVRLNGALPVDSLVTPDRDSTGCRPFLDVTLPQARGANTDTADVAIANAVVWLVGVTHGPRVLFPRRVSMMLDGCHLKPRVLLAPTGATMITSNRDEMLTNLRFVDHGVPGALPREEIQFTDPGQLVPSGKAVAKPGLVEVRDQYRPWVRGFVVVAPHPFVAVTETGGNFSFEGVPTGSYQLVVWHERLGARVLPVRVEQGVVTVVTVALGGS